MSNVACQSETKVLLECFNNDAAYNKILQLQKF